MAGLRAKLRRLPPIAWRDERIHTLQEAERKLRAKLREATERTRRLQTELASLRTKSKLQTERTGRLQTELARLREPKYSPAAPSWHWRVQEQVRVGRQAAKHDARGAYPRRRLLQKLHNYELARSYGVATPRVVGIWNRLEDVSWENLPDSFVLKSNRRFRYGALRIRRDGSAFRLAFDERVMTVDDITAHYKRDFAVGGPFFVEELLPCAAETRPYDIKIYAFYGEIGGVLLQPLDRVDGLKSSAYRYVDAEGEDLGSVQEGHANDPSIEPPVDLPVMADISRVLSRAVPLPFVRIDLYQVPDGVVLGGLTPLPGFSGTFTKDHDRVLGARYDEAEARLHLDLADGRPFAITFGPYNRELSVPIAPTKALPSDIPGPDR